MSERDFASRTKVKRKRKTSTERDESGIEKKVAKYDIDLPVSNAPLGNVSRNCRKDDTPLSPPEGTGTGLSASLLSKVSSSGYGSDFQSPTATKDTLKWPTPDAQDSPADSAFAISPYMNTCTPASNLASAPNSAGHSSGIYTDAETPDIRASSSENTVMSTLDFVVEYEGCSINNDTGTISLQGTCTNVEKQIRTFLRKNFLVLKDDLEPTVVADHLFSDGVISPKDIEMIREETHRRNRCDYLIKSIASSKSLSNKDTPLKLHRAMKRAGCGHLVSDLMKEDLHTIDDSKKEDDPMRMIDIKSQLHYYGNKLKEEIDPNLIIDELVVSEVLSFVDHTYISKTNRDDAVEFLIRCVLKQPEKSFAPFCAALGEQYSDIARLLQTQTSNTATGRTQSTLVLTGTLRDENTSFGCNKKGAKSKSTQVKIEVAGYNKEVEKMIVDDNIDSPSERLAEEAMEVGGLEIDGIQYSSIVIDLASMSCRSQLRFLQRIQKTPSYMETWLTCILSQKSLERLATADAKSISIEISAKWPDCSKLPCKCKLSKETIVTHFTRIEKELKQVDLIVDAFTKCPAFDDETKQYFGTCLKGNESGSTKNEAFLLKVLKCKKSVCLCLFEAQLRETDQTHLLKQVSTVEHPRTAYTKKIRSRHIRMSMNYLLEEVEPTLFVNELRTYACNTDAIIEVIVSKERRYKRCREFLEFIMKGGKRGTDWFVDILQKKNMITILRILQSSVAEDGTEDYAEGIISNYKKIVARIDARTLRQTFVDRREIKAKDFDRIMKHGSRRGRVVWLVKHVLNSQKSVQRCFVDALEIHGYTELAKAVRSEKDHYRECPRLSTLLNQGNKVNIKATFDVKIEKRTSTESPLQISLRRSLFSSKIQNSEECVVDKTENTLRWLETQGEITGDKDVSESDLHVFNTAASPKSPASTVNYALDDGYHTCSAVDTPDSSFQYEDISPASTPGPDTTHTPCFTPGSAVKTIADYEPISTPSSLATNSNSAPEPSCSDNFIHTEKVELTHSALVTT